MELRLEGRRIADAHAEKGTHQPAPSIPETASVDPECMRERPYRWERAEALRGEVLREGRPGTAKRIPIQGKVCPA